MEWDPASLQLVVSVQRGVHINNGAGEIFGLEDFRVILQENKSYVEHLHFDATAIKRAGRIDPLQHCTFNRSRLPLAEPLFKLPKKLRTDLITTIPLHSPQNPFLLIMLQKRLTRLLKFLQPHPPSLLPIILPLRQRFPRHIILPLYLRLVKAGIIHPPARRMHPSICYPP